MYGFNIDKEKLPEFTSQSLVLLCQVRCQLACLNIFFFRWSQMDWDGFRWFQMDWDAFKLIHMDWNGFRWCVGNFTLSRIYMYRNIFCCAMWLDEKWPVSQLGEHCPQSAPVLPCGKIIVEGETKWNIFRTYSIFSWRGLEAIHVCILIILPSSSLSSQ